MHPTAKWVRALQDLGTVSPDFRKSFALKGTVRRAVARVTSMGVYQLRLNGEKVGNYILTPYWTSYRRRIQEQEYDITQLLKQENEVSILLGKGWAAGQLSLEFCAYADHVSMLAEIEVEYEDGTVERIVSDESWQVYTSQILDSELYHGETVDRTVVPVCMGQACEDPTVHTRVIPMEGVHVLERERIAAGCLIITPKGERVLDFGQNMAGYVEVHVSGKPGDRVVLRHAEVLDRDGNFYTANLRSARSCNTYVLGGGEEVFKPTFSFQGFRYVRVDEYPGEIDPENFTAVAVYSDIRRTGDFSCGNDKINQLYSNIIWGQRSNFLDVPTDCPQRDERLGWTGDAQVFCRTAAINYDVKQFFTKWLSDMAEEQGEDGGIGHIVPSHWKKDSSTAWADASVICPWEIYRAYGDKELLRRNFPMMRKWVDYMHRFGEEEFLYAGGGHFGDWLALDAGEGQYKGATQTDLIATAYFAYSTSLLIKAGHALGEDMADYETLYQNVRAAFRNTFMKDGYPVLYPKWDGINGQRTVLGMTQTSLALILRFGLCEETEREGLTEALCRLIRENGGRMTTGFVGTPCILHALSENGRTEEAYNLLLQEKAPSWLFSVNHGATTIWEHWDSQKEDGSFWSDDMNSFNHYAYGSVYDWIFGVALGIRVDEDGAGYRKVTVAPVPDRRLGFAKGSIETAGGKLSVYWRCLEDRVRYEVEIPAGTTATLCLPGRKPRTVGPGSFVELV